MYQKSTPCLPSPSAFLGGLLAFLNELITNKCVCYPPERLECFKAAHFPGAYENLVYALRDCNPDFFLLSSSNSGGQVFIFSAVDIQNLVS